MWAEVQVIVGVVLGLSYGCMLVPFAGMHLRLILLNMTTLESMTLPNPSPYNVGKKANFEQVFGKNPWLWFIPVHTSEGDGCSFPIHPAVHTLEALV